MSENEESRKFEPDPASESGDVEILEVVGVDEDLPAPSADDENGDSDDVVFTLDADVELPAEPDFSSDDSRSEAPSVIESPAEGSAAESELLARLRADYDNLRKRVAREREDFQLQANSSLIEGLLPVLDNFDRALQVQITTGADGAFRAGMVMIYEQFHEALRNEGLRRIESVGQPFDPNLHDAVETDPESSAPPNTVIEEFQRGYLFQNRVLRHALVKVSTNGIGINSSSHKGGGR